MLSIGPQSVAQREELAIQHTFLGWGGYTPGNLPLVRRRTRLVSGGELRVHSAGARGGLGGTPTPGQSAINRRGVSATPSSEKSDLWHPTPVPEPALSAYPDGQEWGAKFVSTFPPCFPQKRVGLARIPLTY